MPTSTAIRYETGSPIDDRPSVGRHRLATVVVGVTTVVGAVVSVTRRLVDAVVDGAVGGVADLGAHDPVPGADHGER